MPDRIERALVHRSHPDFKKFDGLCFLAKNLYNSTVYDIRQVIFENRERRAEGKKLLKVPSHYDLVTLYAKNDDVDYRALPAKLAQEVVKNAHAGFKSFLGSLNSSKVKHKPSLPSYKHSVYGRSVVIFNKQMISKNVAKIRDNLFEYTVMPKTLGWKFYSTKDNVKNIRIIPGTDHYAVEFVYSTPAVEPVKTGVVMGIDLGLRNVASLITSNGGAVLINGNPLKSVNQFYNKKLAELKSKLPKGVKTSHRIKNLHCARNRKIDWEIHNISRFIVNHAVSTGVDTIIVGNNKHWKQGANLGKVTNQNFVSIPYTKLINQVVYKAEDNGIKVIVTEESYTSLASALDNDVLPVYGQKVSHIQFSGKRRGGLYYRSNGSVLNADLNGAMNIARKVVPTINFKGIEGAVVRPLKVKTLR